MSAGDAATTLDWQLIAVEMEFVMCSAELKVLAQWLVDFAAPCYRDTLFSLSKKWLVRPGHVVVFGVHRHMVPLLEKPRPPRNQMVKSKHLLPEDRIFFPDESLQSLPPRGYKRADRMRKIVAQNLGQDALPCGIRDPAIRLSSLGFRDTSVDGAQWGHLRGPPLAGVEVFGILDPGSPPASLLWQTRHEKLSLVRMAFPHLQFANFTRV
jgi:hypothetical protein